MIEIFVMVAGGIGSGVRFIGSRLLGMSIGDDDINDIVRHELNANKNRR